jgi:exoribonuclease R
VQVTRLAGAPLDFAALRSELAVPGEFSSAVLAEAEHAASHVELPDDDATDIPFVTVDPLGSKDLDQALHIAAAGDGYLVSYAIADVAAFVQPGSELDAEVSRRGETLYFPDARVPLHPAVLSEGAASLLPDQLRPAVLWQIGLDAVGAVTQTTVRHARVRSRTQLDYFGLQGMYARDAAPEAVRLLPKVGALRLAQARQRHAINLDVAEQDVVCDSAGQWTLKLRQQLDVEKWNAEMSLLAGMAAAALMVSHGVGVLRTLPPPEPKVVGWLRSVAPALDVRWPKGATAGDVVADLDQSSPKHMAFLDHAMSLLRGATYVTLGETPGDDLIHAGVGAPYAHVTAPLRRLVDRYTSTLCMLLARGAEVPDWIQAELPALPSVMEKGEQRASNVDRSVVDMTEAWLLRDRIGEQFVAIPLDTEEDRTKIAILEPAIRASARGTGFVVGQPAAVQLTEADVTARLVRFTKI